MSASSLLVFLAGNSTCKIVAIEGALRDVARVIDTRSAMEGQELEFLVQERLTEFPDLDVVLCSVIPPITSRIASLVDSERLTVIQAGEVDWFHLRYEPVDSLGADRLCNAIALREHYGFPSIAADFGTATTVTVLNADGDFAGGWILAGLETSLKALAENTVLLPALTEWETPPLLGQSTQTSMMAGAIWPVYYGILLLRDQLRENGDVPLPLVLTGGNARHFSNVFSRDEVIIDADLTLKGAIEYYRRKR